VAKYRKMLGILPANVRGRQARARQANASPRPERLLMRSSRSLATA